MFLILLLLESRSMQLYLVWVGKALEKCTNEHFEVQTISTYRRSCVPVVVPGHEEDVVVLGVSGQGVPTRVDGEAAATGDPQVEIHM